MTSHTWFRDLLYSAEIEFDKVKHETYGTSDVHKVAHEAGKRGDQIERIGRLGGIVAPILNQGDIAGLRRCMPELAGKVPEPCAGSSTSWAQAYLYAVAKMGGRGRGHRQRISTGQPGCPARALAPLQPMASTRMSAASPTGAAKSKRQTNGVAYDEPILDYRWHRFESSIWRAATPTRRKISGRPSPNTRPGTTPGSTATRRSISPSLQSAMQWISHRSRHDQELVDAMSEGFFAADLRLPVPEAQLEDWPTSTTAPATWPARCLRRPRPSGRMPRHASWPFASKPSGSSGSICTAITRP